MARFINQVSSTFASVRGISAVANVAVELVSDALCGLRHALAHLLWLAGTAPQGLLDRYYGRMKPALAPAARKPERDRSGQAGQPTGGRRPMPRPGTERRS